MYILKFLPLRFVGYTATCIDKRFLEASLDYTLWCNFADFDEKIHTEELHKILGCKRFHQLETLSLPKSAKLDSRLTEQISKNCCRSLKEVDVHFSENNGCRHHELLYLAENLPKLSSFRFTTNFSERGTDFTVEGIARRLGPRLTDLRVHARKGRWSSAAAALGDWGAAALARHCPNLRRLTIVNDEEANVWASEAGLGRPLTDEGLQGLLRCCPCLERLDVVQCGNLTLSALGAVSEMAEDGRLPRLAHVRWHSAKCRCCSGAAEAAALEARLAKQVEFVSLEQLDPSTLKHLLKEEFGQCCCTTQSGHTECCSEARAEAR